MKKITNLIVAFVFALSIAIAVINTAAIQKQVNPDNTFATIVGPCPPSPNGNKRPR